jgi:hypothetical protein
MEIQDLKLEKAVHMFSDEMRSRLAEKEREGYRGWDGLNIDGMLMDCLILDIKDDAAKLKEKPTRKLCIDIANRCMMVFNQLNR